MKHIESLSLVSLNYLVVEVSSRFTTEMCDSILNKKERERGRQTEKRKRVKVKICPFIRANKILSIDIINNTFEAMSTCWSVLLPSTVDRAVNISDANAFHCAPKNYRFSFCKVRTFL